MQTSDLACLDLDLDLDLKGEAHSHNYGFIAALPQSSNLACLKSSATPTAIIAASSPPCPKHAYHQSKPRTMGPP